MSRQSKNAKRIALAREITALHLSGRKGPSKTKPSHGKDPDLRRPIGRAPASRSLSKEEKSHLAVVCGKEMRVYDSLDPTTDRRAFLYAVQCAHYGAALVAAESYNEAQR